MKILPVVNYQNRIPLAQAPKPPAFCAAPDSRVINKILGSKTAQSVFKFASNNPFGFSVLTLATTCIIFRPLTIMALPGQKKEDKQYLAVKSIVASTVANSGRILLLLPLAKALEYVGKKAKENPKIVKFPAADSLKFNAFNFAVNNGFAVVLSIGTAAVMTKLIPKVMAKILPQPEQKKKQEIENKNGGAL